MSLLLQQHNLQNTNVHINQNAYDMQTTNKPFKKLSYRV